MSDVYSILPEEPLDIRSPRIPFQSVVEIRQSFEECLEMKPFYDVRSIYHVVRIDADSPEPARLAVEVLAVYFRREFDYDCSQYNADEEPEPRDSIYLLTVDRASDWVGVGAVCFRWREDADEPPHLALAWLWINPFLRREGILSTYWDAFRQVHGDFIAEPPLSPAMEAFLAKRNECWRCGRVCTCEKPTDQP